MPRDISTKSRRLVNAIGIGTVGAGAVGSFYASKWHRPDRGIFVSLVCRSNYHTVKANGIRLKTTDWGEYIFTPHRVYATIKEAELAEFDHVFITTKALPSINTVELLRPVVKEKTMIHLIQNGVGIEEEIQLAFPKNPVVSGVTYIGVVQSAAGIIEHFGMQRLLMGFYRSDNTTKKLKEYQEKLVTLVTAGQENGLIILGPMKDIQQNRWHKLMWNSSFNPISILVGRKNTVQIIGCTETRQLIVSVMTEVKALAEKIIGCPLDPELDSIESYIERTNSLGAYKPSMLVDYEAGRPMEIEVILGNAIRMGKEIGHPTPLLDAIYAMIKLKVQGN